MVVAAPPAELYDRPANAFVAGFIGNPPMNLLPAIASGGAASIAGTTASVRLDDSKRADEAGRIASIGIRPEALSLTAAGDPGAFAAIVEHVELLGHETLVHAKLAGSASGEKPAGSASGALRIIARVPGTHRLKPGERLSMVADPAKVYAFDERGVAL